MQHSYTIPVDDGFLRDSCCVNPEELERRRQAYEDALKSYADYVDPNEEPMTHGIWKCKHGTIQQQCRCPNDTVHLVPCPDKCPQKDEEDVREDN